MQIIVARRRRELIRGRRRGPPVPSEAVDRHVDSAELDHDVGASREFGEVRLPFAENLRAPTFIWTDSQRSTEVIEDDRSVRERLRQSGYRRHLRMVLPRLEAQTQLA